MKLTSIIDFIKGIFDKEKVIGLITYLIMAGIVWYLYDFKVLIHLTLFVIGIFITSILSTELMAVLAKQANGYRDLLIAVLLALIFIPLCYSLLGLKIFIYMVSIGIIITLISRVAK